MLSNMPEDVARRVDAGCVLRFDVLVQPLTDCGRCWLRRSPLHILGIVAANVTRTLTADVGNVAAKKCVADSGRLLGSSC